MACKNVQRMRNAKLQGYLEAIADIGFAITPVMIADPVYAHLANQLIKIFRKLHNVSKEDLTYVNNSIGATVKAKRPLLTELRAEITGIHTDQSLLSGEGSLSDPKALPPGQCAQPDVGPSTGGAGS